MSRKSIAFFKLPLLHYNIASSLSKRGVVGRTKIIKAGKVQGLSIFYRLLIAFLGIVIVISGLLTATLYFFGKIYIEKNTQDEIFQEFENITRYFNYEIATDLLRDLHILTYNPTLDEFLMSSELDRDINARKVERLFLQTISRSQSHQGVYFVDYSGKEKVRVDRTGRIRKYRNLSKDKLFTYLESNIADSISIKGPFNKNGKVLFSTGISKIDADIGRFGGIVVIDSDMKEFLGYLDKIKFFGENHIWIFTPNGDVLKQPQNSKAIFDPRAYLTKGFHGTPALKVFDEGLLMYQDLSIIQGNPFIRLVISIPSSLLLKDVKSVLRFFLIIFMFSIITAFSAALYLSKYLSKPITDLAQAAVELASGNLSANVNVKADGEVKMLVDSFNKMVEDLEKTMVSKDYVDNIIKSMINTLIVVSLEGRILRCNAAACMLLGYQEKELIGQPFKTIFDEGLSFKDADFLNEFINNKEATYRTKDGRKIPMLFSASALRDNKGNIQGVVCLAQDISEQRRLEDQLLHSQKMEAIGTLAGGIAHDFNNILTAIIGYGNILKMRMKEDDPLRHYTNQILASSERAAGLTQRLLAFSRKQLINPQPMNLNEIVKKVEKLLLRLIGEDIELKTVFSDEDLIVMADSGQIEQVLMNLATNARDAMPKGGLISISTGLIELNVEFINTHGFGESEMYALISVTDTGMGIDEEIRERIFEPFFTTKDVGKGTGLGLSIVYGIIKQHNGYINCYSESGKGTTFKVYLPIIKETVVEDIKSAEVAEPIKGGTETVLIAEDEEEIRRLSKTTLEELGYKVIEAINGEDAITKFLENKEKIDLLLFDVIMPKLSGKEAYERIKEIRHDIKALFVSGYPADFIDNKEILKNGLDFISKPIPPSSLLKKVREVLDK